MSDKEAAKRNLKPLGIFRGFAVAGCEPDEMGIGPVFAIPKLLARHGLKVGDIDLWELNEAFASQGIAVLRAAELSADAVLKATQVDGVYTADPKRDPSAQRYERLTHDDAIAQNLAVMDTAAFALARENRLNILVGSAHGEGAITSILRGEAKSTLVTP